MQKTTTTARPVNGTGFTAGKSPRDYLRERSTRDARQFASAAREIERLRRRGQ